MSQQTAGIKISKPGWDVNTCPDYQLIFNSSWPALAIVFDQNFTITYDSLGSPTPSQISHTLPYPPLNMGWQFSDSSFTSHQGRFFPNMDKTNIYLPTALAFSSTVYINLKCYNLDITKPQNYTYIQGAAAQLPYDKSYGIKVAKQGQSIDSQDLRNFILHSRAASPQVLAVVTEKSISGTGTISYTNPKTYIPWAFGYAEINTIGTNNIPVYVWAPPVTQSYPSLLINQGTISLQLLGSPTGTGRGSIILLRDPLFAPNDIMVTYNG